ncbi:hypothetical protein BS78_05G101200 [Paspalum vaginatum]|nr:hypothetical protein BS78_05G101200 [Paspalum vaginatum]
MAPSMVSASDVDDGMVLRNGAGVDGDDDELSASAE